MNLTEIKNKLEVARIKTILLKHMFPNYNEDKGGYAKRVDGAAQEMYDFIHPPKICPWCDYQFLDESEAESAVDCGCPSCRKIVDFSDFDD